MRKLLNRLLESFHINGRDFAVFLLALLLAFSIWLIHNLSLRYNDYLKVSVVARCNIDGHADCSSNRCDVIARCRTRGYSVITSKLRENKKVVELEFTPSVMKPLNNDMFYVTSSDLQEYAHLLFGNDATVDYFISDTLFFKFPTVRHKKVPVHPVHSLSYKDQYMARSNVEVNPDSVIVYGEPFQLENLSEVFTRPVKHYDLSADVQGLVPLEKMKGVRMSESAVRYSIGVTRFVELREKVPVTVVNVPVGKEILIFPSMVELSLRCVFPLAGNPFDDISLTVDYESIAGSISGKCLVSLENLPKGVLSYDASPAVVQCLLEER
ncbi:MAG: hypothetical protein ACI3ZS_01575 [Candidatus Cryptobacteroides sp.]